MLIHYEITTLTTNKEKVRHYHGDCLHLPSDRSMPFGLNYQNGEKKQKKLTTRRTKDREGGGCKT